MGKLKDEQGLNLKSKGITEINREDITKEKEREFIEKCFKEYEESGFTETFWSPYADYSNRIGKKFSVIRRLTEEDTDLCNLPLWQIKFEDGLEITSYAEEIIASEVENVKKQLSAIV